jgi:lipopolysaccharide transport system ATP-binding protein
MTTVISVEHLSKVYRLGQIGTGTFANDLKLWWAKTRGKPNPLLRIGETDHGNRDNEDLWALKDVSFTVKQGEVLGIIGKNGAGKSTLLKILSRVTAPTSGRIKVKGRIASLLEVGTGFHPELTGRENSYLNGAILGMSRQEIDRKFDEIVDFSGVEKFIDTPVKRYSSGMYVRLAFAVAAHLEPEILVVDEVLAVGDAEFQKKCLGKMGEVAKEGRTVLFVSHSMPAVSNLCSTTILLRHGEKEYLGNTNVAINKYLEVNNTPQPVIDFSQNRDKEGMGRFQFTKLELQNDYGKKNDIFSSGQNIKISLSYLTNSVISRFSLRIAIIIYNSHNEFMFICRTDLPGVDFKKISKKGNIICSIPHLPLPPGEYMITIWARSNDIVEDRIVNAAVLKVKPGYFFKTGRLPPPHRRGVLVSHHWGIDKNKVGG